MKRPKLFQKPPKSKVELAIKRAWEVCQGDDVRECMVAWDEVEELSAQAAREKALLDSKENGPSD